MSRLIDADALKANINTAFWSDIEKIIDSAPSIDIVRCKECKYEKDGYCINQNHKVMSMHYCSYGERKDFQVIVNGNCTKCGKPLSGNRIFICEECEEQSKENYNE